MQINLDFPLFLYAKYINVQHIKKIKHLQVSGAEKGKGELHLGMWVRAAIESPLWWHLVFSFTAE